MAYVLKDKEQLSPLQALGFAKGLMQSGKTSWRKQGLGGTKWAEKMLCTDKKTAGHFPEGPEIGLPVVSGSIQLYRKG